MPHFKLIKTSKNGGDKCMPSLLMHLVLAVLLGWVGSAGAANTPQDNAVVLDAGTPSFQIKGEIQSWISTGSEATISTVAADPARFTGHPASVRHPIAAFDTLWIKLRLVRPVGSPPTWTLNIPLPFLDAASL
jgi:hypothetical protein